LFSRRALTEEFDGAPEALAEIDLGTPAEDGGRAPDVDHAALLLARLGGAVMDLARAAGNVLQPRGQPVPVGLDAGADVDRPPRVGPEREQAHARDVAHVDVVARLRAVAVHRDRLVPQHAAAEDRDDPGLAVRVLARPVHVRVAEGAELDAVL